jgi:hypothetical protein
MLKLPGSNLPSMDSLNGSHAFQPEPSGHWMEHFQLYLTQDLPASIAQLFKKGMESAFVNSGLTNDAFERFWQEAATLDPSKRMQFWSDLADGLVAFDRAASTMKSVNALQGYGGAAFLNGVQRQPGDSEFMQQLRGQASQIFDIARQMLNLTGPDRVAAWKQLGMSVGEVMSSLTDYLNRVGQAIKSVNKMFGDARLEMKLQQTDDPNAQIALLKAAADQNLYQIKHAAGLGLGPDEVQQLTSDTLGLLTRIYNIDPSQEAYDWWSKQVDTLQQVSNDALQQIGDSAKNAVQTLLDELQPFKDWFLGVPVDLDPALAGVNTAFDGFRDAIDDLAAWIRDHAKDPTGGDGGTGGGGGGTGGGGDGGNGGDKEPPNKTNSVTIPITVNVTGATDEDIAYAAQVAVVNAAPAVASKVIDTLRNDPSLLESYGVS